MCGRKMKNVRKHATVLAALGKLNRKQAKAVIKDAPSDLIHCLCEICHNLLKGNIVLTPCQLQKAKKHKRVIRALAKRNESVTKKKKILNQKGGIFPILPLLLPALASAVGGIVGKAIGKRI